MAMRAPELKALLEDDVLDVDQAANYLGVQPNSIEVAAHRNRIPFVHLRRVKLFTKADLDDYRERRAPGRASRLTFQPPIVINPR